MEPKMGHHYWVYTCGLTYTQGPPPSIPISYPTDPSKTMNKHPRMHSIMLIYASLKDTKGLS